MPACLCGLCWRRHVSSLPKYGFDIARMIQPTSREEASAPGELRRVLTYWDAVALIAGIMIGSGIFATPPQIATSMDRFGPMIMVWLLGGLLALCGALTYAELAAMFPRTGGVFRQRGVHHT